MKKITVYARKIHIWFLGATMTAMLVGLFFLPTYVPFRHTGENLFCVSLNGEEVGMADSEETAQQCLREARRQVADGSEELVYVRAELTVEGEEVLWGRVDDEQEIAARMAAVLERDKESTLSRCYTVKIGQFTINLASKEDVLSLLEQTLYQYDTEREYVVNLTLDTEREINALTPQVITTREQEQIEEKEESLPTAGIEETLSDIFRSVQPAVGRDFEDYPLGLQSIAFEEKVEVVEAYMPASQITSLADAVSAVTKDQEKEEIYEVQSGDTLSEIAEEYGLTTADLVSMNTLLSSADSMIREGDELTVTVPTPELSVIYTVQEYYEEDYDEDVIYVDNDEWYTNQSEVIQEPSAGHRRVIAQVEYQDGSRIDTQIVKEEATIAAVPKIVERGTKVPPTYIWPLSGGTISSSFGGRAAPKAGASTNHQGIDIAVPTGTAVMASGAGTVTLAGWQSGYGYVVYIQHADGRQTRYGHLSSLLVSAGESVSQGQKIALSGNTGNSTGPHLHFEMRINGQAVNPLAYIS
ncbi:MAG: M23 family metallopeptidase [Eubacteriales bacterium]|nr:M23 family metallopeptidase [Eubacteriales bacterium]